MKKLTTLFAASLVFVFSATAQHTQKWFFTLSSGAAVGGPAGGINQNMKQNNFDHTFIGSVLFWAWDTDYPKQSKYPPLQAKFGKRIKENKSFYILAGIPASGEVNGFKDISYIDFFFFSGSYGIQLDVPYQIYQLAAGYQYSSAATRAKWSLAPSAFIYNYSYRYNNVSKRHRVFVPGANLSARIPMGKEKRRIGVELIAEANIAPPVKMKALVGTAEVNSNKVDYKLSEKSVNMAHGVLGIALAFREKAPIAAQQ